MRSQFTFYKSFDDVIEDLSDKQIAEYVKVMLDVQFLRVKLDDISFTDKTLSIVWKSQRHSIEKSIKGYLDGQSREGIKNPYLGVYGPCRDPSEGVAQQEEVQEEVQEKGEEQEEEKGECKGEFTFSLTKSSQYQNLSSSYKEKLKGYAVVKDGAYQLQQFLDYHEAKGSTFKDWSKSYNTWINNSKKFDKYNPEAYRQELNDHPDYDAVFVEYGTRKVYNAAYDFVVEFKVQQAAVNVKAAEPTELRDVKSLVQGVAERKGKRYENFSSM